MPDPTVDSNVTLNVQSIPDLSATLNGGATVPVDLIVHGDGLNPLSATITGLDGAAVAADLNATLSGGATPIAAAVDIGNRADKPFFASVAGSIGGSGEPIKLELNRLHVSPNIEIKFSLFGLPIFTIRITGTASIGPQ